MAGQRVPGPTDAENTQGESWQVNPGPPTAGFAPPGAIGAEPLDNARIITSVDKDWDPLPTVTPGVHLELDGSYADVYDNLGKLKSEWGMGGGGIRNDAIPVDTTPTVTAKLHAKVVLEMPVWNDRAKGTPKEKGFWDGMIAKLRAHEDRHVAIVFEQGDKLAKDLIGKDISLLAGMVTACNAAIATAQKKLDTDTDHGAKAGVPYGDVVLPAPP